LYNAETLENGQLRQLLDAVARGELSPEAAARRLASLPFEDLGYARVDHHRALRGGPEVVYARGKTPEQVAGIVTALLAREGAPILVTKADDGHAAAVQAVQPGVEWHPRSGLLIGRRAEPPPHPGTVLVVCAGTSDLPVAEEAVQTAAAFGCRVDTLVDVGVAGAHRLFADAGRTSVGYGAAFDGLAALLGMLNSCAVGVSVVNIDNGFGAGALAARILRAREPR
jgi:pyridinium-3,5-biscarboxylic acid mononucleotide synthase